MVSNRSRPAWEGSTRRGRLPVDWPALRAAKKLANPTKVCHICGKPGGDTLDHIKPGDDHSLENLDWVHDRARPHCHRTKSGQEGAAALAAKRKAARPAEIHPALR